MLIGLVEQSLFLLLLSNQKVLLLCCGGGGPHWSFFFCWFSCGCSPRRGWLLLLVSSSSSLLATTTKKGAVLHTRCTTRCSPPPQVFFSKRCASLPLLRACSPSTVALLCAGRFEKPVGHDKEFENGTISIQICRMYSRDFPPTRMIMLHLSHTTTESCFKFRIFPKRKMAKWREKQKVGRSKKRRPLCLLDCRFLATSLD